MPDPGTDSAHTTLAGYLDALASGEGTPGGGSASAITGAIGIALGAMVCRITSRKAPPELLERLDAHIERADAIRTELVQLAEKDAAAFRSYLESVALPKGTDEEKTARRHAMEQALLQAAEVPTQVATLCIEGLQALITIVPDGSRHTVSDVESGGHLLEAAGHAAIVNVRVNLSLMKDDAARSRLTDETDALAEQLNARVALLRSALASQ